MSYCPVGNLGGLCKATAAARPALPIPTSVCCVFAVWLTVVMILMCTQMLMPVIWTNSVKKSALKVDSQTCHTRKSNPHQYCTWLFGPVLCQQSYPAPMSQCIGSADRYLFLTFMWLKHEVIWCMVVWCTQPCLHCTYSTSVDIQKCAIRS